MFPFTMTTGLEGLDPETRSLAENIISETEAVREEYLAALMEAQTSGDIARIEAVQCQMNNAARKRISKLCEEYDIEVDFAYEFSTENDDEGIEVTYFFSELDAPPQA